ncbi:MAG: serine/threonine-protein kinase [Kofleriaceae bacterium]
MAVVEKAGEWKCPACGRQNPHDFAVCPNDATPRTDEAKATGDPLIGEVLGRTYRILRAIGQGGMAKLYEAEHLRIDARYAIKVIHDDLAQDRDLLARFEREARAAGKIHSPQVVRLVDVLRTADGRPCLVTELLEGEDLQTRLDRAGKATVMQAIPVARQICMAAAAAHAVGVVHRDLKPANVFVCTSGEIKVFDFGVAKIESDEKLTRTESVMGTAAYMAPEQARRAAAAGPLADVYSIGAILYHMLTGQPPYGNVPALSRFALVLHEEPDRPRKLEPTIPDGVEGVIQAAMARDPAGRVKSAHELDALLAAFDKSGESRTRYDDKPARSTATPVSGLPIVQPAPSMSAEMQAQDIALKAKLARPIAAFVACASAIGLGAWLAAFLAVIIKPTSTSEHALLAILGLAATAGLVTLHVRRLQPRWNSGPAASRYIRSYSRTLVVGTAVLGGLTLVDLGMLAMFRGTLLGPAVILLLTGVAAVIALGWRSWGLDERLRRWMG